jgi:hypothetical protein
MNLTCVVKVFIEPSQLVSTAVHNDTSHVILALQGRVKRWLQFCSDASTLKGNSKESHNGVKIKQV